MRPSWSPSWRRSRSGRTDETCPRCRSRLSREPVARAPAGAGVACSGMLGRRSYSGEGLIEGAVSEFARAGRDPSLAKSGAATNMVWDPMYTLRRLLDAIPQPGRRSVHPARASSETPMAGYGCCPACHEFVCMQSSGPSTKAVCPNCGRLIDSLDALGSDRSNGRTDEL